MRLTNPEWRPYSPVHRVGKLCYHLCTMDSELPLRKVAEGYTEPNYETSTYNYCDRCNQPSVRAAVNDGLSHILFITRYKGKTGAYAERYFIVGYYEIGWTAEIDGKVAVRPKNLSFVPIEHAFEITPERWKRINRDGITQSLTSLWHATQRIQGDLLTQIVQQLDEYNRITDYLRDVAQLKTRYNPYDTVPTGCIFIINVGANTEHRQQSPLYEDGTFEFVPIPGDYEEGLTYADVPQFYYPNKPLLDRFEKPTISPSQRVHNDPEFATFTYGDNTRKKGALRQLEQGDLLFYLARLVPYAQQQFNTDRAIFALIGYLEIDERLDDPVNPLFTSPAFNRNAHVRRWENDPASFDDFVVFKGSTKSRRFRYAVPFDRELVEHIPILTAEGTAWRWGRTSDNGVIASYTRTARLHIDPNTDPERAERFWTRIGESQRWT